MKLLEWLLIALSTFVQGGKETEGFLDCVAVETIPGTWGASGVLIGSNVVLTTGQAYQVGKAKETGGLTRVFIGRNATKPGAEEQVIKVVKAIRHPDFQRQVVKVGGVPVTVTRNDLTILILERNVDPAKVPPARRATPEMIKEAKSILVAGFGANDLIDDFVPKGFGTKRMAEIRIVSWGDGKDGLDPYGSNPGSELVAVDPDGRYDINVGDAGAPAYVRSRDGGLYLAAIAARTVAPNPKTTKRAGDGAIYVRIDRHWDWIQETAAKNGGKLGR